MRGVEALIPGLRVVSGPEQTRAADALRQLEARRDQWPYPWLYPPPESIRRNPAGSVVTPDVGSTAIALQFSVPQGFQADMVGVMFGVYTTAMVAVGNPGDYVWTITRNMPQTGTVLQGVAINDFLNFPFPLGSPTAFGTVPLPRSENFGPTDVIRVECGNVGGAVGAPNYALAMLALWLRKA